MNSNLKELLRITKQIYKKGGIIQKLQSVLYNKANKNWGNPKGNLFIKTSRSKTFQ